MLSAFVTNKLSRVFKSFDADGNGYVEKSDFDEIAKRIAGQVSSDPKSAEYAKVLAAYENLWTATLMSDANGDGRVSPDEFLKSWEVMVQPQHYETTVGHTANLLFQALDSDGNGSISSPEFSLWFCNQVRGGKSDAVQAFSHLDHDASGAISNEELLKNVREYFTSDDRNAPGNWLFGAGF